MAKQVQEDSQLEHDDNWIEYIFPINTLSKSRLKQLKVAMNSSWNIICSVFCVCICMCACVYFWWGEMIGCRWLHHT